MFFPIYNLRILRGELVAKQQHEQWEIGSKNEDTEVFTDIICTWCIPASFGASTNGLNGLTFFLLPTPSSKFFLESLYNM